MRQLRLPLHLQISPSSKLYRVYFTSGLHISTFLRQLMFDSLYALEYVVLLTFGFSSDVKDLIDQKRKPILISVILVLSMLALALKLTYYNLVRPTCRAL